VRNAIGVSCVLRIALKEEKKNIDENLKMSLRIEHFPFM
jgi:hypothetical protein